MDSYHRMHWVWCSWGGAGISLACIVAQFCSLFSKYFLLISPAKVLNYLSFFFFKKPLICAHQGWIYLIKNIVQISNVVKFFFFKFWFEYIWICHLFPDVQQPLLQSSHDPSEIIIICWCGAQLLSFMNAQLLMVLVIFNVERTFSWLICLWLFLGLIDEYKV